MFPPNTPVTGLPSRAAGRPDAAPPWPGPGPAPQRRGMFIFHGVPLS